MSAPARSLLWPGIAAAVAVAILAGLGVWQLRRLGEKEALIARVEARAKAAPVDMPDKARWPGLAPADAEFTHARARGHFLPGRDALIFMKPPEGFGLEPGYLVLTPFALEAGGALLVERGFVPASKVEDVAGRAPPDGAREIVGLLRAPQSRNLFTPADQPDRLIWFTREPAAMADALGLAAAAPVTLALESPSAAGPNGFPRLVAAAPEFVNNHLSYAFTWFSLAAALVVIFGLYARGRLARGV